MALRRGLQDVASKAWSGFLYKINVPSFNVLAEAVKTDAVVLIALHEDSVLLLADGGPADCTVLMIPATTDLLFCSVMKRLDRVAWLERDFLPVKRPIESDNGSFSPVAVDIPNGLAGLNVGSRLKILEGEGHRLGRLVYVTEPALDKSVTVEIEIRSMSFANPDPPTDFASELRRVHLDC